jgi:hypothetical protein
VERHHLGLESIIIGIGYYRKSGRRPKVAKSSIFALYRYYSLRYHIYTAFPVVLSMIKSSSAVVLAGWLLSSEAAHVR